MSILLIIFTLVFVGIDQIIKYWAVNSLKPVGSMDFIRFGDTEILDLTYLENDGAIFGSMSGQRWFLVGFTALIIIAGFVFMFIAAKQSKFFGFSIMLFVSGGIGNIIDRIRQGYVVDMFEIKLFDFAVFNFADICVTCAFVLVLIYTIFSDSKAEKSGKQTEDGKNE